MLALAVNRISLGSFKPVHQIFGSEMRAEGTLISRLIELRSRIVKAMPGTSQRASFRSGL